MVAKAMYSEKLGLKAAIGGSAKGDSSLLLIGGRSCPGTGGFSPSSAVLSSLSKADVVDLLREDGSTSVWLLMRDVGVATGGKVGRAEMSLSSPMLRLA